ncbi:MAG: galactokinase [Ilumatobacteraceae bacterium]
MTAAGAPVRATAPGRVNLIGDHTDYTGGLVLPMAIDRATTITGHRGGTRVRLDSADESGTVDLPLDIADPTAVKPAWGRYVAGVVAEGRPTAGFEGRATTTIPIGAGLSSSAALEVAVALALGVHDGEHRRGSTALGSTSISSASLAALCQRAEQRASGVPCGIMDQLTCLAGIDGHALLIDCHSLDIRPVPVPDDLEIVVWFVAHRTLAGSAYAQRVAECATAEREIGPLRAATSRDVQGIADDVVRRRATHVVGENDRVRAMAAALAADDRPAIGALLLEGHRSLAERYETSTPEMDAAVEYLASLRGVHGARMTGGGFGGCVVAVAEPGSIELTSTRWRVRASVGASVTA